MHGFREWRTPIVAWLLCVSMLAHSSATDDRIDRLADAAKRIVETSGVHQGLIVHVGCGSGRLTAALRLGRQLIVQGLDTNKQALTAAQGYLLSEGLSGPVSVRPFDGENLPYADNMVNLLVIEGSFKLNRQEVLRVLRPGGTAVWITSGSETEITDRLTKPWPAEVDQWTHYLHDADGNPVARDTVVAPPKHCQWIAGPLWLRSHESDSSVRTLVTAGGRLFYIVDEAPASLLGPHDLPDKWFLAARDAFNGVLLWKVPIADWGWRSWKPSWFSPRPGGIPLNIEKRLVATADHVYVTLGYRAPVSQLDARTGKVLQTYKGTERTGEILYLDGKLILAVLEGDRVRVMLLEAESGRRLWTSENAYQGTTVDYYRFRAAGGSVPAAKVDPTLNIATDGRIVALLDGDSVAALDLATGKQLWRSPFPLVEADYKAGNIDAGKRVWNGALIVIDGVVVHASPNQLAAFDGATGRLLWKQPKKYLGHLWYEWKDVFVIDKVVWTWSQEVARGQLAGANLRSAWPTAANGYDLHTGKLVRQVALGPIFKTHHHHRCYRDKATVRYILASRRGTEFVDLQEGLHTIHNWVRGTCHVGMMPANGLQYVPPHPCVCYIEEKLSGFLALAPGTKQPQEADPDYEGILIPGPAYGEVQSGQQKIPEVTAAADRWPTLRGDMLRSGSTPAELPTSLKLAWETPLGSKLGAPIVAAGRVFVPVTDQYHLAALDAATGQPLWRYSAGSRIDSPPTYWNGTVVFGSADGWVYCLRADDGRLVWRFRAAPAERQIGAFGRLESAWPIHGSVLLLGGTVYVAAGRSSHLDGGIWLFGLDAATGKVRYRRHLQGPSYNVRNIEQNYGLPMGTLSYLLQSDGRLIYMHQAVFDMQLNTPAAPVWQEIWRVRSKTDLLDGSYFKRVPWIIGRRNFYARLIVHDDQTAFGLRMFDSLQGLSPHVYFLPGKQGYLLFAVDRQTQKITWQRRIAVRGRAMVAAKNVLYLAGPPDVVDPDDPLGAFEGRKGGVLCACDRVTGQTIWQCRLPSPPVLHGMAAADGRLFITMENGSTVCFAGQQ